MFYTIKITAHVLVKWIKRKLIKRKLNIKLESRPNSYCSIRSTRKKEFSMFIKNNCLHGIFVTRKRHALFTSNIVHLYHSVIACYSQNCCARVESNSISRMWAKVESFHCTCCSDIPDPDNSIRITRCKGVSLRSKNEAKFAIFIQGNMLDMLDNISFIEIKPYHCVLSQAICKY